MLNDKDKKKLQKHIGFGEEVNFKRVDDSSQLASWKAQCEICGKIYECEAGEIIKFALGLGDGCA